MKFSRFSFTVPIALFVTAIMNIVLSIVAILNALILTPVLLTKDLARTEIEAEKKRELADLERRLKDALEKKNEEENS